MPSVTIYTKTWCPYCMAAKDLLEQKGIAFKEIEITGKPDLRDEMLGEGERPLDRAAGLHRRAPCRRLRRPLRARPARASSTSFLPSPDWSPPS